jgi:hypothetical protein
VAFAIAATTICIIILQRSFVHGRAPVLVFGALALSADW